MGGAVGGAVVGGREAVICSSSSATDITFGSSAKMASF